jgi:hypothetical protein
MRCSDVAQIRDSEHILERSPAGHSQISKAADTTLCDESTEPSSEAVRSHLQIPAGNGHKHNA